MITPEQANAATTAHVATLYSLGARLFEIALLPSLVPAFSDSANNLNPGFTALVPQLRAEFPDAVFGLSNWGPFYDDILNNPSKYGITNTTDPCFNFGSGSACSDPDKHFYYFIPSVCCVSPHRRQRAFHRSPGAPQRGARAGDLGDDAARLRWSWLRLPPVTPQGVDGITIQPFAIRKDRR
jgi:phospholipase/lecithinase/hemolysin